MLPKICEAYRLSDFCKDLTGIQQIQDEREVMPPNSEAVAAASAATEHLDNDRPIQCPLPEPSILNSAETTWRIWGKSEERPFKQKTAIHYFFINLLEAIKGNTVQAMTAQQRDGLGLAIGVYNGGLTTVLEAVAVWGERVKTATTSTGLGMSTERCTASDERTGKRERIKQRGHFWLAQFGIRFIILSSESLSNSECVTDE